MTVMPIERVEEDVDLSDLDLLDEMGKHIHCIKCQPIGAGVKLSLCGQRFFALGVVVKLSNIPPDACEECGKSMLSDIPCARCGA